MLRRALITNDVDAEVLKALGRVVVEFNLLEFSLSTGLRLMVPGKLSETVAAELPTRALANVVFSLLKDANEASDILEELDSLRRRYAQAEEARNRYLHSLWGHKEPGLAAATKSSAKAKRGLVIQRASVDAKELIKAADGFRALAEDVVTLLVNPRLRLPAPETSDGRPGMPDTRE